MAQQAKTSNRHRLFDYRSFSWSINFPADAALELFEYSVVALNSSPKSRCFDYVYAVLETDISKLRPMDVKSLIIFIALCAHVSTLLAYL